MNSTEQKNVVEVSLDLELNYHWKAKLLENEIKLHSFVNWYNLIHCWIR